MRKFRVRVNNSEYEVEIEEIEGTKTASPPASVSSNPVQKQSVPTASKVAAPSSTTTTAAAAEGFEGIVTAQMPGTIIDIHISEGDQVRRGQNLLTLEAMKMANEVVAPQDGTVGEIRVTIGASVNAGDILLVIS